MTDSPDPRLIRIPGPHVGGWGAAHALPPVALRGDATGLRLVADPTGPLRLDCADGSLGRLILPRGLAVDRRLRVYLLDRIEGTISRHDPGAARYDPEKPFAVIPAVGNHEWSTGADNPRRFAGATTIAAGTDALYVLDRGSRRVLGFAIDSWALRDVWCWAEPGVPLDVATHGADVFVLTTEGIDRFRPGDARPRRFVTGSEVPDEFAWPCLAVESRLAIDRDGTLYVLARSGAKVALRVYGSHGRKCEEPIDDATAIRSRFPFPAIRSLPDDSRSDPHSDSHSDPHSDPRSDPQYVMPESLTRLCGRMWPEVPKDGTVESELAHRPAAGAFVFDGTGQRVAPDSVRPSRSRLFATGQSTKASWISRPLDSGLYDCRWDAITLEFADLPPGSMAVVETYTSNDAKATFEPPALPDEAWALGVAVAGPPRHPAATTSSKADFPIDSPPGRYLWLRVRFMGDGFSTPVLKTLETRFPRRSYLEHLPAVFSEDEAGRRFLEGFLGVFQAEWDNLERRVDDAAGLFDPKALTADAAAHLDALAGWLGVRFDSGLNLESRRRMLARLPSAFFATDTQERRRTGTRGGTPASLRACVAAVLATDPDVEPSAEGFPFVIDGYRDRDHRLLPGSAEASADEAPLWGPDSVGRFQLGVTGRLDDGRLLPAGPPDLDAFAIHANRFRVVVPAAWLKTPAAEAAVRRAIEREKPAHTAYELRVVAPGFRLGVQATIGVDTILGDADLGLGDAGARLGSDAKLPNAALPKLARLDAGVRLGTDPARI